MKVGMIGVWKEAVGRDKVFFTGVFLVSLAVFLFLMNVVSIYGLVYYQQIIVPEGLGADAFVFLGLFSFLVALSVTLHKQKWEMVGAGGTGTGVAGVAAGLFTSACPVCAPLILSLLGIPAAAAIFPLGGWEVRAVSIALLVGSIWLVSRRAVCAVPSGGEIASRV